jgi:hypothetical protein
LHIWIKLFISVLDSVPITRRDIKILLHHLEEQNEIIQRLDTEVSYVRKLLEKGGMGDFTSTDEFIKVSIFILFSNLYLFKFKYKFLFRNL